MGISTLIIFIATLLVAAVAAAVLISTSNVLQQRTLLVGQEARKSITNAVEVISVLASSNSTQETFNDFEILIRLSAGSDPLQMRLFDLQYISEFFDAGADLFYKDNQTIITLSAIDDTWTQTFDLDGDGVNDTVRVVNNTAGLADFLQFNLTNTGLSEHIQLGVDLSNSGVSPKIFNLPEVGIIFDQDVYGSIAISNGRSNADYEITGTITIREVPAACTFSTLQPETKYCFQVVNGNDDMVLASGERFKLLYKLKDENVLPTGSDFSFIFTNEKGRMTETSARTPDVAVATKAKLWPIG